MSETTENLPAKKPVQRKEIYDFQYHFSEEELREKSKQLAKACEERNRLEDEKKSIMAQFKSKIESKTAEINLISNHISTGHEWLSKSCDVLYDFDRGIKRYIYEGIEVGQEKMKAIDYQLQADLEEKQPEQTEEDLSGD